MADIRALRQALAEFLGRKQYPKFIEQGMRGGRLRHWQEEAWEKFVAAHPEFAIGTEEMAIAFRVCHLHGDELCLKTVEVFHGCLDYSPQYHEVRRRSFPRARHAVSTEGNPFDGDATEIWHCPACDEAADRWANRQRREE